jgi:NADH-quinone oxidoreductase subunit G
MFLDYELIITSKILIKKLGFLSFDKKINININDYYLYYLNPNFYENIKNKKIFIFVGYNLRLESPILNIKLRKKKIKEDIFFIFVGSNFNDNLNCKHLGLNIINLINYLQGKLKISNLIIKKMKKLNIDYNNILDLNIFLLGNNIILREDNKSIINIIKKKFNFINLISLINTNKHNMFITGSFLKNTYIYFKKYIDIKTNLNILNLNLSNILYEELNMFNNTHNIKHINNNDIVYMFGIDNFFVKNSKFCIFQGHHLNLEYLNIDLIFPNVTFLEKSSNYLDIEGNILQTNFILYPPVFSRND